MSVCKVHIHICLHTCLLADSFLKYFFMGFGESLLAILTSEGVVNVAS